MPRSKRKAAQARSSAQEPDFVKKKQRLGSRGKPANQTSVSFKSRQVHVPSQGRAPTSSSKPGLSLPELLQRAGHYNASTRLAAFNGLVRAIFDTRAAAYAQARLQLSSVLAAGLDSLCDDSPTVRRAARELAVACVGVVRDVRPFARLLAATLNAGLSHVRKDIRVDSARATTDVLCVDGVTPELIFKEDAGNPLDSLKDLLAVVTGANSRVHALQAVAAVCGSGDVENSNKQKDNAVKQTNRVFYYQRRRQAPGARQDPGQGSPVLLQRMSSSAAGELLTRVTYLGVECMPLVECRRDASKRELLTAAAVTLRALACGHSLTDNARPALKRFLKGWAEEARRGGAGKGLAELERALAGTALAMGEVDIVGEFLLRALGGGGGGQEDKVDGLVRTYLREGNGRARSEVGAQWADVFQERGAAGDAGWVERGSEMMSDVLATLTERERGELVESAARVGMGMAERAEWGAARKVMEIVAREVRGEWMGQEVRRKLGEVIAEGVARGACLGDGIMAEAVGTCAFYGGVAVDERVLRGMLKGVGKEGVGSIVGAVEAGLENAQRTERLNGIAALEAMQKAQEVG